MDHCRIISTVLQHCTIIPLREKPPWEFWRPFEGPSSGAPPAREGRERALGKGVAGLRFSGFVIRVYQNDMEKHGTPFDAHGSASRSIVNMMLYHSLSCIIFVPLQMNMNEHVIRSFMYLPRSLPYFYYGNSEPSRA